MLRHDKKSTTNGFSLYILPDPALVLKVLPNRTGVAPKAVPDRVPKWRHLSVGVIAMKDERWSVRGFLHSRSLRETPSAAPRLLPARDKNPASDLQTRTQDHCRFCGLLISVSAKLPMELEQRMRHRMDGIHLSGLSEQRIEGC